jgi:hypothetical protein
MTNDRRPHILRPGSILGAVLAAAIGYYVVGPHVSDTVLTIGVIVVVVVVLGVGYLQREPVEADDDDLDAAPSFDGPATDVALRWGITAAFFVFGVGIGATAVLPVLGLPVLAGVLIVAIDAGVFAYRFAMGRA